MIVKRNIITFILKLLWEYNVSIWYFFHHFAASFCIFSKKARRRLLISAGSASPALVAPPMSQYIQIFKLSSFRFSKLTCRSWGWSTTKCVTSDISLRTRGCHGSRSSFTSRSTSADSRGSLDRRRLGCRVRDRTSSWSLKYKITSFN